MLLTNHYRCIFETCLESNINNTNTNTTTTNNKVLQSIPNDNEDIDIGEITPSLWQPCSLKIYQYI